MKTIITTAALAILAAGAPTSPANATAGKSLRAHWPEVCCIIVIKGECFCPQAPIQCGLSPTC